MKSYCDSDIVKSCPRLESGLRFGPDGIRACVLGAFAAPLFWTAEEAARTEITKKMIIEKRQWLFDMLNDGGAGMEMDCRHCQMVREKPFGEVQFHLLGQIDHAATTVCNLRCKFCGFTHRDLFIEKRYDDLAILRLFSSEDVEWDSVVDFNGGEPTLLPNVEEYLDYFHSRRIRVRFMTNGVQFHQAVYDGLANGTIQWACTSVDAGTPSTYLRIKQRDAYLQVLENLTRYAHAGSKGGGMLAMKYIFCSDNCSDDDIAGFAYAALAIRPHQVWLTFDFTPFGGVKADTEDFGDYDFSKDISAYAKMFTLLQKHGVTCVHYTAGHLALISRQGKILLDRVLDRIEGMTPPASPPELVLGNFRRSEDALQVPEVATFLVDPLRIARPGQAPVPWSLGGKRILIAPACPRSADFVRRNQLGGDGTVIGFVDRDPVVQGKQIDCITIFPYSEIDSLGPDHVLVVAPVQHQEDIVRKLINHVGNPARIAVLP